MNAFYWASSAKAPVTQLYSDLFILFPERNCTNRWCYASVSLTPLSIAFVSWREMEHTWPLSDFFHCVKPQFAGFNCHTRKLETLPSAGFASDRISRVMCVGEKQKQSMSSVDLGQSNFLPPSHSNELSSPSHLANYARASKHWTEQC